MRHPIHFALALAALTLWLRPVTTRAEAKPKLAITADRMTTDEQRNRTVCEGHVSVTYGETKLTADKAVLQPNAALKPIPLGLIEATGNVTLTHEKHTLHAAELTVDGRLAIAHAKSVRADLVLKDGPVHLEADEIHMRLLVRAITATGSVRVKHSSGTAQADKVEINLLTREMKLVRPRIQIQLPK